MIHPQQILDASTNSVQQEYMRQILNIYERQTDDAYDSANLLAALNKASYLIKMDTVRFMKVMGFESGKTNGMIDAAMLDWANWDDKKDGWGEWEDESESGDDETGNIFILPEWLDNRRGSMGRNCQLDEYPSQLKHFMFTNPDLGNKLSLS